jgi:hypothetical protein
MKGKERFLIFLDAFMNMTKGSQNKDSKIAYEHAIKSLGQKRKCNGIFHKGYNNGEKVESSLFKRQGEGYQAFCSDCDQARQNIQKTLKRVGAIVMTNNKFRIKLPKEFRGQEQIINKKIRLSVLNSKNILNLYTNLVEGKNKLNIKELGLYKPDLSVKQKKRFIDLVNKQVRNIKNNNLIEKKLKEIGNKYKFKCSMCKRFYLVSEVQPNISQSRDIFDLKNQPTRYKLPLHNVCYLCMVGERAESIRHYIYLCNGDFTGATRMMTLIGKKYRDKNIHADHIIPLRLGGKHDPKNLRPFIGKENTKKRDKLTHEALDFMKKKNLKFKELLTDWYYPEYKKVKENNLKFIETVLRHVVDEKRNLVRSLSLEDKKNFLLNLYPTLNSKELERIIRKCFS